MFNSLYIYIYTHTFGHITRTPGEILHARRVALTATIFFTRESCELIPSWWYWMPPKDVSFKVFEPSFEVFEVTSSGRCWEGSLLRLPMKLWRPLPRTMDGMMNSWLSAGPTFPFRWVVFVQSLETMKCGTCSGTKSARLWEPRLQPRVVQWWCRLRMGMWRLWDLLLPVLRCLRQCQSRLPPPAAAVGPRPADVPAPAENPQPVPELEGRGTPENRVAAGVAPETGRDQPLCTIWIFFQLFPVYFRDLQGSLR